MITSPSSAPEGSDAEDVEVHRIVQSGPRGAIAVAGFAVALVVLMWLAFYFLVFVPRAPLS
jgi:hypothetical protein